MRRDRGFTLIEMMVVLLIVAVLAALLYPVFANARRGAKEAVCQANLLHIGQALAMYRQDYQVYPLPDKNPISVLATTYKSALSEVPHCPNDPEDTHDTYGEFYNYYGFEAQALSPVVLSEGESPTCFAAIQTAIDSQATAWNAVASGYALNACVRYKQKSYLCNLAHTPDASVNEPGVGPKWASYWEESGCHFWSGDASTGSADADFPGLMNANAPGNTIVTLCPHHTGNKGRYIVLRKNGEVEFFIPPLDDPWFWALNKSAPKLTR